MNSLTLLGGGVIVGLALIKDANATIQLTSGLISVGSAAYIGKKIVECTNRTFADMIDTTGKFGMGICAIGIVGLALTSLTGAHSVTSYFHNVASEFAKFGQTIDSFKQFIDKWVIFWN